eukprot:6201693-Pleurochrysis_carterae.AAC.7
MKEGEAITGASKEDIGTGPWNRVRCTLLINDLTRLLGPPVALHRLARRPSLRDWAGRRGREVTGAHPSDRVPMPQSAAHSVA